MKPKSNFSDISFVRLPEIIGPDGPLPISRSSFYERVRKGEFPKPIALGPRTRAWRVEDIRALLAKLGKEEV